MGYVHVMLMLIVAHRTEVCRSVMRRTQYTCRTQQELVQKLRNEGFITSKKVANVMSQVDYWNYVQKDAYKDIQRITKIGLYEPPPRMHAIALELLKDHLVRGKRVLDVGSTSGYMTMCMAFMVGKTGYVLGLECNEASMELGRKNVVKEEDLLPRSGKIKFKQGNGFDIVPQEGSFDVIYVALAVRSTPELFLEQLRKGGRLVIPRLNVDHSIELKIYDKDKNGKIKKSKKTGNFRNLRELWFYEV